MMMTLCLIGFAIAHMLLWILIMTTINRVHRIESYMAQVAVTQKAFSDLSAQLVASWGEFLNKMREITEDAKVHEMQGGD